MSFDYKLKNSEKKRKNESEKMLSKYPNRIPVIVEKVRETDLPKLDKHKFLVPNNLLVSDFLIVLRKRIKLTAEQNLYIFVNNEIPLISERLDSVYRKHKDTDGFLYFKIAAMETYG